MSTSAANQVEFNKVRQIIEYGIDMLDQLSPGQEACDLHHALYNTDYFIIGRGRASEFLGDEAFTAIGIIQEYETLHFGTVSTDLSEPERVANMLAYIIGEEALQLCDTLQKKWDEKLSDEELEAIKKELEDQI